MIFEVVSSFHDVQLSILDASSGRYVNERRITLIWIIEPTISNSSWDLFPHAKLLPFVCPGYDVNTSIHLIRWTSLGEASNVMTRTELAVWHAFNIQRSKRQKNQKKLTLFIPTVAGIHIYGFEEYLSYLSCPERFFNLKTRQPQSDWKKRHDVFRHFVSELDSPVYRWRRNNMINQAMERWIVQVLATLMRWRWIPRSKETWWS